jgi:hypothetical protein
MVMAVPAVCTMPAVPAMCAVPATAVRVLCRLRVLVRVVRVCVGGTRHAATLARIAG